MTESLPKVVMILQARMGSMRLPGKSMMDLAGEPLVGRILERVKRCQHVDEIVLAIPDSQDNLPLRTLGEHWGVSVYAGSEEDLVDRYYQAALSYRADIIVRIPADNAVPQHQEIDRIINYHLENPIPGFSSNLSEINNSGYPDGIGAEVFDFCLLKDVWSTEIDKFKREHVHLNFYNYDTQCAVNEDWCPINTVSCPEGFRRPDLILDVNTLNQYRFIKKLYLDLYHKNPNFSILDVIIWYDSEFTA